MAIKNRRDSLRVSARNNAGRDLPQRPMKTVWTARRRISIAGNSRVSRGYPGKVGRIANRMYIRVDVDARSSRTRSHTRDRIAIVFATRMHSRTVLHNVQVSIDKSDLSSDRRPCGRQNLPHTRTYTHACTQACVNLYCVKISRIARTRTFTRSE